MYLENRWKRLHMFGKSSFHDLESSTMIHADSVSLMIEFRSIRRFLAFPGQIHR